MSDLNPNDEIKNLRLARKLSQQDIARLTGVPLRTYQRFESGDRGAKLDTLLRVLDALGLSLKIVSKRRPALDELNTVYGNEQ
jgi:transcriptional regulator with XRE-family HTH domain